jgi:hypothetical protein
MELLDKLTKYHTYAENRPDVMMCPSRADCHATFINVKLFRTLNNLSADDPKTSGRFIAAPMEIRLRSVDGLVF